MGAHETSVLSHAHNRDCCLAVFAERLPCIGFSLLAGLLASTALIPVLFYTYQGILGFTVMAVDIAIFYISVIAAFFIAYKNACQCPSKNKKVLLVLITVLTAFAFFWFTYHPPALGIFANPELTK